MGTGTTMPIWETIRNWVVNARPATQKRVGNAWVGMPGGENPKPGNDYRLAIVWGPRLRRSDTPTFLDRVVLRVVFLGWKIGGQNKYRNSMRFYTDASFSTPASPLYRVHLDLGATVYKPIHVATTEYAYFRVATERDRAWRMRYTIGIYGMVYQRKWYKVTAR